MYLHLLVASMVWINTYAHVPTWSGDGVSDSHDSQHLPQSSSPSILRKFPIRDLRSGPGASYLVAWVSN